MDTQIVWDSLASLYSWVKREKYLGWDPYDGLSGDISQRLANKSVLNIAMIQLNLYSPVNLRPLFGIQKGRANKALALFSRAYLYLYSITNDEDFKLEAKVLLRILESQNISNDKNKFSCASYYFPYISPKHYLSVSIPDIICVTETTKSFVTAYEVLGKRKYLRLARRGVDFLVNELLGTSQNEVYFKYTPEEKGKVVFNISALALETIASLVRHIPSLYFIGLGEKVVELLLKHQREDGAWPYSIYTGSNIYYWQIDYHQGFILDGLIAFLSYIQNEQLRKETLKSIELGVSFYMNKQFSAEGWSYYRYPIKYPIDIHNQAQGIITFSKLYKAFDNPKYLNFAERIAEWTIKNMQDSSGYFYTHKWPGFVNKISYMRWAQAWMMLALSTLIFMEGNNNESSHGWTN
ncbi:hypothetical protein E3E38_04580 [Thermococcus sp. 18S1]|uniref:hypothetical protein n=1 Tax=Thermococcus sp. 18S1 TaxID=1638210 RepID=UPI00143A6F89|nr:hypothetical protein [Thermococcus sp. 18S1]NJE30329.1 hypothetical protein [Thermococcus sp. 18S1]